LKGCLGAASLFYLPASNILFPHLNYNLRLRVMRLSPVGSHDPALHSYPRSHRDSRENMYSHSSIRIDQVPEFGGVGFALVEPEVY